MTNYSPKTKNFFLDVYDVVRLIPTGRVSSYGAIARYLGSGKSARMVGWAMNACHNLPDVPAHRVVNSQGLLTGKMHFETPFTMEEKLRQENIIIEKDQVKFFKDLHWDPTLELSLDS